MPFPTPYFTGNKRYWTRERVIEGLVKAASEIRGPLPCCDSSYAAIKKGHYDWPTASRVLEMFGSMACGWQAAGVNRKRISMNNLAWTQREDEFLLDLAGDMTLKQIASRLCRSYASVRRRLYHHGVKARLNQGWLSAAEVAKYYNCPYHRVRRLLTEGILHGTYDNKRNSWQVDLKEVSDEARELLKKPKRTHVTWETDVGDYYSRYKLKRSVVKNKLTVVTA